MRTMIPKLDERNGSFEGYLATWFTLDDHGDMFLPGAFDEFTDEFIRDNHISLAGHQSHEPIGKYVAAWSDDVGFWVKGVFTEFDDAQKLRTLINQNVIQFLSVGVRMLAGGYEYVTNDQAKQIQHRAGYSPTEIEKDLFQRIRIVRVVSRAMPYEGTPTTVPANKSARIIVKKESVPPRVSASLDRIRSTAASLKNREAETGIPDNRLSAIHASLELVTKEVGNMIQPSDLELDAETELQARQRLIGALMKAKGMS